MRLQRKLWLRRFQNAWRKMRHRKKWEVILGTGISLLLCAWLLKSSEPAHTNHCMPIDVVYTWVNGSDPAFIAAARQYDPGYDQSRFDDKNELRYSLRSLELYAPWVRHIYIVTNGQIPHWLDLNNERVTIVPHDVLTPHPKFLPTFSSAAIETFLHRIPNLSQRFVYLNDDIFLGAPLYPEDLYTDSEGVRVYQAWVVPDCGEDCPWTYVNDGICDAQCNIPACQNDGGDCDALETSSIFQADASLEDTIPKSLKNNVEIKTTQPDKSVPPIHSPIVKPAANNTLTFQELMQRKNLTTLDELKSIVDKYNQEQKLKAHLAASTSTRLPVLYISESYRPTKDVYSQSLLHTNRLLNIRYGFQNRNVVAHVGFLMDRNIISAMQDKFSNETYMTASHRFREPTDLQYAFAYYSFLMSERENRTLEEVFDEFDTDSSHTWSDREIRTFLARVNALPLNWSVLRFFEQVVNNCSQELGFDGLTKEVHHSTLPYERYEDSNLPKTISKDLVINCPKLVEAIEANFSTRPKYKYRINSKRNLHSNFVMLRSNVSEVVESLDTIRKHPRKFNCINDNLEPQYPEHNDIIRSLLEDFYLSFFPHRSKFELPPQYRNRYENWWDYLRWRRRKRAVLIIGYAASVVILMWIFRFLCMHKAKCVRRYVQKL